MSVMELYDPAFPCDPDLPDGSETAVNEDTDVNIANTTHDECSQLQLSSIELPPEPYKPELFQNAETSSSSNKEHDSKDCAKAADIQDYPKKSNSSTVTEDSCNKVEDADGDDAIEDDARYRDELKKLAAVRQTKDFESKSAKDVPLEIYLGPSVGFRVDLTMNKNRKLSVESIAKKCHDDVFERLSPERRGKAKSAAKSGETQSGSRIDFKSPSKTPVKSDVLEESSGEVFRQKKSESSGEVFRQKKSESSGEVFRQKKSESSGEVFRQKSRHNERSTFVESGEDSDKDLRSLLRKREAENQALLAVPRVVKMKHLEGKTEDNLTGRSDETPPSRKSRPHENDRDRFELSSQKRTDYSDPKRSKQRRYEAEMESDHPEYRDGSTSRKSNAREKEKEVREREVREREEPKRSKPSKHVREEEYESRHRSEERPRAGRSENKELSSSTNKSRDRERLPEIVTDPDHRSRRKRRNSRSVSNEHKKKLRKSKSRSPKRKRDRSKSSDRRRTKDGRSKSREQERRHEKKSEAKLKNDDRYVSPPRHKKDHRHHRSRSKTPVREPESKKATRSRHSDIKEPSYYEDLWPSFDDGAPRSDRNKSKQPSLRELQERSTSLLEACMKTRYENQGSGDDRHRSRRHRHKDKRDFVQSLNFGRTSGKPGSVDYITLSDSDEGIVWSDNEEEEEYGNYNCLPAVRSESSKKQKYEDIYSSRSLQCTENRLPSRSPPKPPKSRSHRESSLSPSAIIAINLKRKENSKRLEKLKITKRVSRSSLEPGEIDDGSSLDLSDNGLIEEEPTRRMVSLINEDEGANRWPGDKVPIQIHVITSHGDGRSGKADEIMSMTDCDDNIAGFVTTTDDAVGVADFPLRCDQKADAQLGPEEDMMCVDEHDSDDKELPGDLVICTGNSPLNVEKPELHLTSDRDGLDLVYASQKTPPIEEHPVAEDFKKSADVTNNGERQVMSADPLLSTDAKSKDVFDFVARKDDSFFNSPKKTETIPGLGDVFPSPVKEQDIEPSPVGTRNLSSFYHIKKKTNFEQASLRLDLNSEPLTPKAHGTHLASPRKALSQKEDPAKTTQNSSPQKSPNVESAGPASHQMSSTFPQNVPGMPKTSASSIRVSEGLLTVDTEPLPPSDRQSSKLGFPKLAPSTNAYILNQNAIVDLLASFPSSSSALIQQPVSAAASHDDNPISKLLAAFNPMLGTLGAASSANLQSQKLIDDIVKSTAVAVPVGSPQMSSIDSKTGSVTDDRLTNIFNMQKKLLELTRISAGAPQPAAPFSQKLVQDIFKAVLVPTSSAMKSSSDLSSLCPRTSEIPISLSQDNSLSPTSPFNVDAASPLSGEIMSFSPPSIPDTNSPVVMKVEKTPKQMKPESKNSTHKTKSKDGKSAKAKPEDDVKDKKSKSDIQKLVVEEVKTIIRPFYSKGRINKDEYKEIMRKTVPSICNSKTQDFSKTRITIYVEAYIRKVQAARKYHAKKKDK